MKRNLVLAIVGLFAFAAPVMADILSDTPQLITGTVAGGGGIVPRSPLVYDNTQGALFSTGSSPRSHECDDGSFGPQGGAQTIDAINVGFVVATANTAFDIVVGFYSTMTANASPVNSGFVAGFRISEPATLAAGAYQTGLLSVTPFALPAGSGGSSTPFGNWGFEYYFLAPGSSSVVSTAATGLFAGGPQALGSSANVYWRDANSNFNCEDPGEERSFGTPPTTLLANLYLQLTGTPEPGTLGLLALGALMMIKRRR